MASLTFSTGSRSAGAFRAVGAFFANIGSGIQEGRAIRDRYERLIRLSDGELRRLGLDRSMIPQAALRGIEPR